MALVPPRQVTSGYYRNNLYVLLGLNVLATLVALAGSAPVPLAPPLAGGDSVLRWRRDLALRKAACRPLGPRSDHCLWRLAGALSLRVPRRDAGRVRAVRCRRRSPAAWCSGTTMAADAAGPLVSQQRPRWPWPRCAGCSWMMGPRDRRFARSSAASGCALELQTGDLAESGTLLFLLLRWLLGHHRRGRPDRDGLENPAHSEHAKAPPASSTSP